MWKQSLEVFGYGTQRLEETLGSHFANTPIIRIDRDTTRRKKAFEQHLEGLYDTVVIIILLDRNALPPSRCLAGT